jgi:hypothetical protein
MFSTQSDEEIFSSTSYRHSLDVVTIVDFFVSISCANKSQLLVPHQQRALNEATNLISSILFFCLLLPIFFDMPLLALIDTSRGRVIRFVGPRDFFIGIFSDPLIAGRVPSSLKMEAVRFCLGGHYRRRSGLSWPTCFFPPSVPCLSINYSCLPKAGQSFWVDSVRLSPGDRLPFGLGCRSV